MRARRIATLLMGAIVLLVLGTIAFGQGTATPPNPYQPTEVQALRLKVAQQAAQLAQAQLREAQANFQSTLAALTAAGEKVRAENKWPEDVVLNLDSLQFNKKVTVAPPALTKDKK
jgi:GAF domain-containing protein